MKLKRAYRSTSQRLPCAFVNVIGCHSSIGHDSATSSVARRSLFLPVAKARYSKVSDEHQTDFGAAS
jgi:hypothetical protein